MAHAQHCSNAFHLRPDEMHFTMHFKSQGQVATVPPEIYSIYTFEHFFQQKRHVPSHIMFVPRCNFIKIPRELYLSLVSHF